MTQEFANEKLRLKGHLFLNDVYDMLDIPRTKAGQIVGWVYDEKNPVGDNYVDFGIYELYSDANRRFVNGLEPVILLDFNVDGNILDLIWFSGLNGIGTGDPKQNMFDYPWLYDV